MNVSKPTALVIHSWTVFAHPLFIEQFETLACQVDLLRLQQVLTGLEQPDS